MMLNVSQRTALTTLLRNKFSLIEMREVAHSTGVDPDDLGHSSQEVARELVMYCERRNLIRELLQAAHAKNDALDLTEFGGSPPAPTVHGVLSAALNDGFSQEEIVTMTFDVMQPVYREGRNKLRSELVASAITYAMNNGLVSEVWSWIAKHNPHIARLYGAKMDEAMRRYIPPNCGVATSKSRMGSQVELVAALLFYAQGGNDGGVLARGALGEK